MRVCSEGLVSHSTQVCCVGAAWRGDGVTLYSRIMGESLASVE